MRLFEAEFRRRVRRFVRRNRSYKPEMVGQALIKLPYAAAGVDVYDEQEDRPLIAVGRFEHTRGPRSIRRTERQAILLRDCPACHPA